MSTTILAEKTRLDLGHTDLEGCLVFQKDTGQLVLMSPSGSEQVLGAETFDDCGTELIAQPGCVFIEAFGLKEKLPAALLATGLVEEVSTTRAGMWSAPLHEMRLSGVEIQTDAGVETDTDDETKKE